MIFEGSSNSFQVYETEADITTDILALVKEGQCPTLDSLRETPIYGWTSARFLLDREITEETMFINGWFCGSLLKAEKKVPSKLLKSIVKLSEYQFMQDQKLASINKQQHAEIKAHVHEELIQQMPPTLTNLDVATDCKRKRVFAECRGPKQKDAFEAAYTHTTQAKLVPMIPELLAFKRAGLTYDSLGAVTFSPDAAVAPDKSGLGLDFLTWLLFRSEEKDHTFRITNGTLDPNISYALAFADPITFLNNEGAGSYETSLRKGTPILSSEAKTALMSGKKLARANIAFVLDENHQWSASVDAQTFAFRSVKVPRAEEGTDERGRLVEKLQQFSFFVDAFYCLFDEFLEILKNDVKWEETVKEMQDWIEKRTSLA